MNIISLIDENISSIVDYYNLSKVLYEEIINYMNTYKTYTFQYSQKISNLQKEFENKITCLKEKYEDNIYKEHLFEYIIIFPNIIKKQLTNYSPLFNIIELFIKDFGELMNQKINLIKTQQEQYNDSKRTFLSKFQEIENMKSTFFNNLSLTEETIIQNYSQKRLDNEDLIYNHKSESNIIHIEKVKKSDEKMNNLIMETKTMEKNYKAIIESSKLIKQKVKENSEKTESIIQNCLKDISEKYHKDIINIMGVVKIGFQEPLSILNNYLNKMCQVNVIEELDELYKNFSNKSVASANIFPSKYKLKSIGSINNSNNNNIFSSDIFGNENEDLEDINNEKEEISEINLLVIKLMYNNFTLLSANKIDIKAEEEKVKTKKLSNKLFLNIKTTNNTRKINQTSDKFFSEQDYKDLEKLMDKDYNRFIFLLRLTRFRALKYDLSLKYFMIIGKLLNSILQKSEQDNDYFAAKNCIILSQTFYYDYQKEKIYLKAFIQNNHIFKNKKNWELLLENLIKSNENNLKSNSKENAFGNIYTLVNTIFEFGGNENLVKEIIEPKIKLYNLDNNNIRDINELIKTNVENKKYEEERKKYEKYIKEITELYNKELDEEIKEKEKEEKIDTLEEKKSIKSAKFNRSSKKKLTITKSRTPSIWELDEQ